MRWHASFGTFKNNFTCANRSRDTVDYSKNCPQTRKFRISGSGFRVNEGSHWLVDARDLRGESWRARAADCKGNVQAPSVGITAPGVDRVAADKAQTYCPRLEGLVPWFCGPEVI